MDAQQLYEKKKGIKKNYIKKNAGVAILRFLSDNSCIRGSERNENQIDVDSMSIRSPISPWGKRYFSARTGCFYFYHSFNV